MQMANTQWLVFLCEGECVSAVLPTLPDKVQREQSLQLSAIAKKSAISCQVAIAQL